DVQRARARRPAAVHTRRRRARRGVAGAPPRDGPASPWWGGGGRTGRPDTSENETGWPIFHGLLRSRAGGLLHAAFTIPSQRRNRCSVPSASVNGDRSSPDASARRVRVSRGRSRAAHRRKGGGLSKAK